MSSIGSHAKVFMTLTYRILLKVYFSLFFFFLYSEDMGFKLIAEQVSDAIDNV